MVKAPLTSLRLVSLHPAQASAVLLVDSPYGAFAIGFLTQGGLCQGAALIVLRAPIYRGTSVGTHLTCGLASFLQRLSEEGIPTLQMRKPQWQRLSNLSPVLASK